MLSVLLLKWEELCYPFVGTLHVFLYVVLLYSKQSLMLNTTIFYSYLHFYFYLQILVIFCGPSVVKVHVIRSIASQIVNKETLGGLILIVQNHITAQALKAVDLFPFKAEIFQVI